MRKRMVYAVLVAVALAVGFAVSEAATAGSWDADGTFTGPTTVTTVQVEDDDFIMGCASLWPFC